MAPTTLFYFRHQRIEIDIDLDICSGVGRFDLAVEMEQRLVDIGQFLVHLLDVICRFGRFFFIVR